MDAKEEKFLREIYEKQVATIDRKTAQVDPYENSMWANLIDSGLKGLEVVALATFDWKLTSIVKLLQSWVADKKEERRQKLQREQFGSNYDLLNRPQSQGIDPYGWGRTNY